MRIAVCDDNVLFLKEIEQQVRQVPVVTKASYFSDIGLLLQSLQDGEGYDAVLLDIQWNEARNGIDIAEELYSTLPHAKIIYVTGYTQDYAQQVFLRRANLSGFLSKPVVQELLEANLQKVAETLQRQAGTLTVKSNGSTIVVPFQDVYYMESKGHTVVIHTAEEEITIYERLQRVAEQLPANFFQCHKSFVVNMRQIKRFQTTGILLKNGEPIPVSRSRYPDTRNAYFSFVGMEV